MASYGDMACHGSLFFICKRYYGIHLATSRCVVLKILKWIKINIGIADADWQCKSAGLWSAGLGRRLLYLFHVAWDVENRRTRGVFLELQISGDFGVNLSILDLVWVAPGRIWAVSRLFGATLRGVFMAYVMEEGKPRYSSPEFGLFGARVLGVKNLRFWDIARETIHLVKLKNYVSFVSLVSPALFSNQFYNHTF